MLTNVRTFPISAFDINCIKHKLLFRVASLEKPQYHIVYSDFESYFVCSFTYL